MVAFSDGFWEASLELLSSLLEQQAQADVVCCTTIIRTCAAAAEWRTPVFGGRFRGRSWCNFCCLLGKHQTSSDGMICADNCTLVLRSIKSVQKMLQLPFVWRTYVQISVMYIIMGLPACVRTNLVPTSFPHVFCCRQCFLCAGFLHGPTYRKTCSYPWLQHNMPEILERDLCIYIHRSERRWRNGGSVRGHDKPVHGSCAIYFPGGITI